MRNFIVCAVHGSVSHGVSYFLLVGFPICHDDDLYAAR